MRPPTIPTTIPITRDDSKQIIIMKSLYNSLIEYREPKTDRILIQVFMCLPSRKDFPDYFNVIAKPIAMNKIRGLIERQHYPDEESCMDDFKMMFSNCKFFNEDDSQIYKDAVTLENILNKRREELLNEHGVSNTGGVGSVSSGSVNSSSSRTNRDTKEGLLNAVTANSISSPNISPSIKSERLQSNNITSNNNHATVSDSSQNNSNNTTTNNKTSSPSSSTHNQSRQDSIAASSNNSNNTPTTITNNGNGNTTNSNSNNFNATSNHHKIPTIDHKTSTELPRSNNINSISNNNGINNAQKDATITQQSDSTSHSTNDQQNGCEESNSSSIEISHNFHNETSMDSSSNLSADLLASTPVEKCSLNTRRGRNSDAPKRQLLTGYIIYASEIRKQVIDKNPNQNFGDISRLVGNEWKALPYDIRSKYDQRALIHNKRVRERAQRDLNMSADGRLSNGLHTPKLTKRKLAKLAKEQMRQHHLSISGHDDSSAQSPRLNQDQASTVVSQAPNSTYKHPHNQRLQPQTNAQATSSKSTTVESSTQTTVFRFVEPPTKKRLVYSDTFIKYIEGLQVPNKDLLAEETTPERPAELPTHWLGDGIGRHESTEAALWALRDFMLQDAVTMRRSIEPYL